VSFGEGIRKNVVAPKHRSMEGLSGCSKSRTFSRSAVAGSLGLLVKRSQGLVANVAKS
jgi:hypothetical protein